MCQKESLNMINLRLKKPLTIGKITVSELNFRDHTVASDYLAFDRRGGVAQRIALIASMSGNDESLIEKISGADYLAAVKLVDDLMADDEKDESVAELDEGTLTPTQEGNLQK